MKIRMQLKKQTPGTYVYEEESKGKASPPRIPSLYIRKMGFPDGPPARIIVIIEEINGEESV